MTLGNVLSASTDSVIPFLKSMLPRRRHHEPAEVAISEPHGLRAVGYRAWPEEGRLEAAWQELLTHVSGATVFQTPIWQHAALAWPQRLGRLLLITVWDRARLIAVLPLQAYRGSGLESAGAVVSDYLDPLIAPGYEEAAWRSIFTLLREHHGLPDSITLRNIPPQSRCRKSLPRISAEEGFTCEEAVRGSSCFLPLPKTWDDYLSCLKGRDRKELRRKVSKAESQAAAFLEPELDAADTCRRAEHVLSLIEAGRFERGFKCRWILRGLITSSGLTLAAQKWMRVFSLNLRDRPSAGIIVFRHANGLMAWATGYDQDDSQWSPGAVVFSMMIRRAIEEGAEFVDLLRGECDYKSRLGAVPRPLHQLTLRST